MLSYMMLLSLLHDASLAAFLPTWVFLIYSLLRRYSFICAALLLRFPFPTGGGTWRRGESKWERCCWKDPEVLVSTKAGLAFILQLVRKLARFSSGTKSGCNKEGVILKPYTFRVEA